MLRLLAVTLMTIVAAQAAASDPRPIRIEKPRPAKFTGNIFGLQVPSIPAPQAECVVIDLLLVPNFSLTTSLLGRLEGYNSEPSARAMQLLNESEDLRQAREEFRQFWMNNQPSTLPAVALRGAIGP